MITRVVRMTFKAENLKAFIAIFKESAAQIASFPGCDSVKLMYDINNNNRCFTLSKWQSEDHLELYRSSELFKSTWAKVKPLFSEKAEAWSLIGQISE